MDYIVCILVTAMIVAVCPWLNDLREHYKEMRETQAHKAELYDSFMASAGPYTTDDQPTLPGGEKLPFNVTEFPKTN